MYTEKEYEETRKDLRKRWLTAWIPSCVLMAVAVPIFVIGQLQRNDSLWLVTTGLSFLAAAYFIFYYGVAVKPSRIYLNHIGFMLEGPFHVYEGKLKSFTQESITREGLFCHAVMLNVGEKDDPKDDRLVYWDTYKVFPNEWIGKKVSVKSNNNMIASMEKAD